MGRRTGSQRRKSWRSKRLSSKAKSIAKASRNARFARRKASLNAKRGTDRTGSLKINVSARRALNKLSNTGLAKAMGLSGFGKWAAKKVPKSWKVNYNLKTAIKSKIGEKNYKSSTSQSAGSGGPLYLTPEQAAAYDFYNRWNPQGRTIAQAKKAYRRQLAEGYTLKDAMRGNPAETGYYEALIDDGDDSIRSIYKELLGREADQDGLDYWKTELGKGMSLDSIKDSIKKSDEYKNKTTQTKSGSSINVPITLYNNTSLPTGHKAASVDPNRDTSKDKNMGPIPMPKSSLPQSFGDDTLTPEEGMKLFKKFAKYNNTTTKLTGKDKWAAAIAAVNRGTYTV